MAEGTVDNLNIQLSADANRAVKSLNSLTSTLNRVNKAFNGLNTKNIGAFSNNVNKLANSLKALNGIKISAPNISGLSKELSAISKIDFSKINSASQPLRELGNAVQTLFGLQNISIPKLDSKNINSIINFVEKLNSLDTKTIPNVSNSISKTIEAFSSLSSVNIKDNGINKTINALNRLFNIDLSNFNAEQFGKITGAISTLGNMPDVSSSINRFISSISRLANAGSKTGQTASSILLLAKETKKAARELSGIGNISDDINMFVQSIGRLASAGGKTGQTASGMKSLANETLAFFNTMKNAPRISQNTIAMTQALAQLANAGGKVGTATNTVSSAFDRLSNISSRAGNAVKNAASKIVSAFKNIGSSSKHVSSASLNLKNLLGGALLFSGIRGLTNFTKSAIDLGSAITEVENVVDVSFGNMASKAYEFAETATEQFGLSELQAKQYAGTMMAVLNSSGVAQESAAEMSTTLAGLAGDLASFYNITQENAWEKIMSGMAGEIEPLRRLGINLSVANLQAYALSQGITKSWQSMTQAEQVMLRYNYLLQLTSAQQGDFARTSGKLCAA